MITAKTPSGLPSPAARGSYPAATDRMDFYAHTDPNSPDPRDWEPLFTPFGDGEDECRGANCKKCENLDRFHGHLNKVAWWTAKFAGEMFPAGSEEENAARTWGRLAGLWHDLGKFAPEWQDFLQQDLIRQPIKCSLSSKVRSRFPTCRIELLSRPHIAESKSHAMHE